MAPAIHSPRILFDTASLTILYDHRNEWVHAQWHGHQDDASARSGCAQLLAMVRQTGSTRIFNDSSEAFGEWYQAAEWIGQEFMVQLHEAGVRAIAWVNAMDWPTRSCVASTLRHTDRPLTAAFEFDEKEAAMAWLATVR